MRSKKMVWLMYPLLFSFARTRSSKVLLTRYLLTEINRKEWTLRLTEVHRLTERLWSTDLFLQQSKSTILSAIFTWCWVMMRGLWLNIRKRFSRMSKQRYWIKMGTQIFKLYQWPGSELQPKSQDLNVNTSKVGLRSSLSKVRNKRSQK